MEILNITIESDTMYITVDDASYFNSDTGTDIYIDTLDNVENRYSLEADDHTYSSIVYEYTEDGTVVIDLTTQLQDLDRSAFTVLVVRGDEVVLGFYYDDKELYYKQVELLTNPCSTCLSKHGRERIMLFLLKKELFDYALDNNMEERIFYYIDIARMLDIDFKYNSKFADNSVMINKKCKCCGNCCSLC